MSSLDAKCALRPVASVSLLLWASVVSAGAQPIAGPFVYNGHSYYLLAQANWTDSEAAAVVLGGHLVTINDAAENDFIYAAFSDFDGAQRGLWIGLTDQEIEGDFAWASGEALNYTDWGLSEPNDWETGEDYVHLYSDHAVNLGDLALLLAHFGTASGATYADGDLNGDGDVELGDLALLLLNFAAVCAP